MEPAYLLGFLFGLAIGLFIWLGIGAFLLRAACGILKVDPTPGYGRAMFIVFASACANFLALFGIGLALGVSGFVPHDESFFNILGFFISAGVTPAIYSSMLPESFGKSFLVWLLQFVLLFVFVFVIALVVGGIAAVSH